MEDLTPQQTRAAVLLAAGISCKETAATLDVTPQTIPSWRSDRDIQLCVNRLQWEFLRDQQNQIQSLIAEAVSELRSLMLNSTLESIRLRTALEILKGTGLVGAKATNVRLWREVNDYCPA